MVHPGSVVSKFARASHGRHFPEVRGSYEAGCAGFIVLRVVWQRGNAPKPRIRIPPFPCFLPENARGGLEGWEVTKEDVQALLFSKLSGNKAKLQSIEYEFQLLLASLPKNARRGLEPPVVCMP